MRAILQIILQFFNLSNKVVENKGEKIPFQEEAIKERANTVVIREDVKQDRILDKDLRKEPKQLLEFNAEEEDKFLIAITWRWILYTGDRTEINERLRMDDARILTREQERHLRKEIKRSGGTWFIIRIHPLTIHEQLQKVSEQSK